MSETLDKIAAAAARAKDDFVGLITVAVFLGIYSGIGLGTRMSRNFPTLLAIVGIGLAVVAIGAPGIMFKLERAEVETLRRARR
jgi:hypothetical protein